MRRTVFSFVCKLQGYKTSLQNLHWDADNLSQHKLCDDIMDRISDFEDQVSEVEQSISGNLKKNKLVGTEYKATSLKKFVEDVIESTNEFYHKLENLGDKYIGMRSDCESFLSDMQRNLYLVNFTIKEDFKRNYKNKIHENMKANGQLIEMSGLEFNKLISESVNNVLSRLNEGKNNDPLCTHYAVNRFTNLIVNGWNYSGHDNSELIKFKRDYFFEDLEGCGFNPKAYKILGLAACKKQGLDPDNDVNWSSTGVFPCFEELKMYQDGENIFAVARERHPDWFVEN